MQCYCKIKYFSNIVRKSSLTLYSEMNFSWGKRSSIEWCFKERKKWSTVVASRVVAVERNKNKPR
jgi:hypothetical protein